jgi:hypothetical protein
MKPKPGSSPGFFISRNTGTMQKKIYIYFLFSFTWIVSWGQLHLSTGTTRWMINGRSSLTVNGSTNVNKFSCEIRGYDKTDIMVVSKTNNDIILSGSIRLNILSFDCHNAMMTRDLRKTLRENEFPRMHISFLSLNEFPDLTITPKHITGVVDIEIAGTKKRFKINYQVSVDGQNVVHLVGYRDVNFSDFKLVPPKRLGGMVRAKDKLSVVFHLIMHPMEVNL